jgi:glycerol uptake facilitator-like aquaporin
MGLTGAVYIVEGKFKEQWKALVVYHVAEIIGAYFGMLISYAYLGTSKLGCIKPESLDFSVFYVFIVELMFTFIMMMVIVSGKYP